jgi:purine-binding chemotaxis protein CheW
MADEPKNGAPSAAPGAPATAWEEIRWKLMQATALSTAADQATPEAKGRILKERAAELARRLDEGADDGDTTQVLEFGLGNERYAVETSAVREICRFGSITPMPGLPPFILGVISVRGRICSVVDIGRLFEGPPRDIKTFETAVVIRSARMEFAIVADEIHGTRRLALDTLQTDVPTLTGVRKEYLRGITPERVAVLDAHRMLSDDKLVLRKDG